MFHVKLRIQPEVKDSPILSCIPPDNDVSRETERFAVQAKAARILCSTSGGNGTIPAGQRSRKAGCPRAAQESTAGRSTARALVREARAVGPPRHFGPIARAAGNAGDWMGNQTFPVAHGLSLIRWSAAGGLSPALHEPLQDGYEAAPRMRPTAYPSCRTAFRERWLLSNKVLSGHQPGKCRTGPVTATIASKLSGMARRVLRSPVTEAGRAGGNSGLQLGPVGCHVIAAGLAQILGTENPMTGTARRQGVGWLEDC